MPSSTRSSLRPLDSATECFPAGLRRNAVVATAILIPVALLAATVATLLFYDMHSDGENAKWAICVFYLFPLLCLLFVASSWSDLRKARARHARLRRQGRVFAVEEARSEQVSFQPSWAIVARWRDGQGNEHETRCGEFAYDPAPLDANRLRVVADPCDPGCSMIDPDSAPPLRKPSGSTGKITADMLRRRMDLAERKAGAVVASLALGISSALVLAFGVRPYLDTSPEPWAGAIGVGLGLVPMLAIALIWRDFLRHRARFARLQEHGVPHRVDSVSILVFGKSSSKHQGRRYVSVAHWRDGLGRTHQTCSDPYRLPPELPAVETLRVLADRDDPGQSILDPDTYRAPNFMYSTPRPRL